MIINAIKMQSWRFLENLIEILIKSRVDYNLSNVDELTKWLTNFNWKIDVIKFLNNKYNEKYFKEDLDDLFNIDRKLRMIYWLSISDLNDTIFNTLIRYLFTYNNI